MHKIGVNGVWKKVRITVASQKGVGKNNVQKCVKRGDAKAGQKVGFMQGRCANNLLYTPVKNHV